MSLFCFIEEDFLKVEMKKFNKADMKKWKKAKKKAEIKWKKLEMKWEEAEYQLEKAVAYNKDLQDKILKVCEHKH